MQADSKKLKSIVPGSPMAIAVVDHDIAMALRIFRKQTKLFGILEECQENRWFKSKAKTRREQRDVAKYKESKNAEREK